MIDKTAIIPTVLQRLKKLPLGHWIDVRTYKRNRSVAFVRTGDDNFLVIQNGYEMQRFTDVPLAKIKKLFQTLLKKEFPRSTKVRLYTMGEYSEEEYDAVKHKVL